MTLSPPDMSERFTVRIGRGPRRGGMTAASIVAHLVALTLLTSVAVRLPASPPEMPAIPVIFSPPAAPAQVVETVARASLAPSPLQRAAAVRAPAARTTTTFAEDRQVQIRPYRVAPGQFAASLPDAATVPAASAPRAASAMAARDDNAAVLLRFAEDLHALVRAAATMPAAAVRQHREGRAQVRFAYLDGTVQQVAVAQSSQSRLLDDAALQAVQHAHYPLPPPQLRGRVLPLLVWIDFRIQSPG